MAKGDVLGTSLPGHCGPAPCVHWGVRRGEEYLNPLAFVMDLRPSVLLPLEPGPADGAPAGRPCGRRPRSADAAGQTMAEMPVMARPVTRVLISCVPS